MPSAKYTGTPGTGGKRNIIAPTAHIIAVTVAKPKPAVFSIILHLQRLRMSLLFCITVNDILCTELSHQERSTTVSFETSTLSIIKPEAIKEVKEMRQKLSEDNRISRSYQ